MKSKKDNRDRMLKIRFPGFSGPLTEKKLSDVAVFIDERAGESKYILMSVTSGVGLISQIDKFGREIAGNSSKNYLVIRKWDFAYNKSATKQYPEGYISMLVNQEEAAVPNSIFSCFRIVDKNLQPRFLDYMFHANLHGKWLRKFIEVGARAHGSLSVDDTILFKMPIAFPNVKEQQKITDCLTSLDDLISAESQKLGILKDHKKGLMQYLFPAEDETVPKLRFPKFRGEWKVKSLKFVCHMQAGKFISASDILEKGDALYPCYGGNGLRGYTKTYNHNGKYPLIGRQGALCGNVTFAEGKFYATEHAIVANPKEGIDVYWLFYKLVKLNLNQYATGQAQPGLSVDNLEKLPAYVPVDKSEQQEIAVCLSSLDYLINAQSKKIDALKSHKKGLIQQLFPSAVQEL